MAKGANIALRRELPDLKGVVVGVSWNTGGERSLDDNLALLTVLVGADGRALSPEHVVYFNQLVSADLSTAQLEQALGGDDEQVEVELDAVPDDVAKIVFVLYLSEGGGSSRTLGQLRSLVVRLLNLDGGASIISTVDFADGLGNETALKLVELYKHNGDWKIRALGLGYSAGLAGVAKEFGVPL
ncbi:TerD family protein [Flexivirga sp. ID2601S]|uniref:TerD family protein n=1 Tax=Flexivirga aerilata TaxID=1656889 RepID=A0A849ACU9_9MICO|nr:TerD family protein [Flexivirga aerilata]NNG38345.1 TerD family protein [Flexivirga aerilata]